MIVLAIEEYAGQHAPLQLGRGLPRCKCGGVSYRGSDLCMWCGRYVRTPSFRIDRSPWEALMRERPHGLVGRRHVTAGAA